MMPPRTRPVTTLLLCAGVAACSGRSRSPSPQAADSTAPLTATAAQAPANLAGSWALRAENRTRMGPRLELAFDSVTGSAFRVRVAFMMSGDVGIDPTRFETTSGNVSPDGTIHFVVRMRDQTDPLGEMAGTQAGDTIRLRAYRWVGEDQTAGGTRWLLVRQPR